MRLLALLDREELTVAELAEITRLAQPRVSTHLARLREHGLVADRREGVSVYYRLTPDGADADLHRLWDLVQQNLDDGLIGSDRERLPEILARRAEGRNWPDTVAGDMERHYSPGRTWEATARALVQLIEPGRVLDIASGDGVMGELLGAHAQSIDCVDLSTRVVRAGQTRVRDLPGVHFHQADMHALPFADGTFDTVLMLHALTYSPRPEQAIAEAARVLDSGGRLLCATLRRHRYLRQVRSFGHINSGFTPADLESMCRKAGLEIRFNDVTSIEKKAPNFEIITLLAAKS